MAPKIPPSDRTLPSSTVSSHDTRRCSASVAARSHGTGKPCARLRDGACGLCGRRGGDAIAATGAISRRRRMARQSDDRLRRAALSRRCRHDRLGTRYWYCGARRDSGIDRRSPRRAADASGRWRWDWLSCARTAPMKPRCLPRRHSWAGRKPSPRYRWPALLAERRVADRFRRGLRDRQIAEIRSDRYARKHYSSREL